MALSRRDVMLVIVPMFHVNAWGLPFVAAMLGMKIVLPGPHLDSPSICELFRTERITLSAGVPTIWMAMLRYIEDHPDSFHPEPGLRLFVGGAPLPESVIQGFEKYGVSVVHAWGMTETSPVATISTDRAHLHKQGLPLPFIDIRTVNANGVCPTDGETMGELEIRGPWIAASYFQSDTESEKWAEDGWLRTGDVATIDKQGYMRITDRTKDLIKSGGEWISSVDLENALMSHPQVHEAAVIAVADPKWQERPFAGLLFEARSHT